MSFLNYNTLQFPFGLAFGYEYVLARAKEKEIIQGKNYYVAAPFLMEELLIVVALISSSTIPLFRSPLIRLGLSSASVILPSLAASVKHGNYHQLVQIAGSVHPFLLRILPSNKKTIARLGAFAEKGNEISRVLFTTATLGLMLCGEKNFAAGILSGVAYQILDERSVIPRRVSLFVETYMPSLLLTTNLIKGSLFSKLISFMELNACFFYTGACLIQQMIDHVLRFLLKKAETQVPFSKVVLQLIPSVAQIDRLFSTKQTHLSYKEILQVLELSEQEFSAAYEINPGVCMKEISISLNLPQDKDFKKFLTLFDEIDWMKRSTIVLKKLQDDERFIDFFSDHYPESERSEIQENITDFIALLASKTGVSVEQYSVDWMREQLVKLVETLNGTLRVEGMQSDLELVMTRASSLLPHCLSLKKSVELEDILLKLSIEGGQYCGLGLRRVFNELWDAFVEQKIFNTPSLDLQEAYEKKILYTLEKVRRNLLDGTYSDLCEKVLKQHSRDNHLYDMKISGFKLGWLPMSRFERSRINIVHLIDRYALFMLRQDSEVMYSKEMFEAITSLGNQHFTNYMLGFIATHPRLSEKEKTKLHDKFACLESISDDVPDQPIDGTTLIEKFQRLLLIKLGVLIPVKTVRG